MNHQPPDYNYKFGHSEIIKGSLYLGGEDDVDVLLYGEEASRHLNGKGAFEAPPSPQVDTWIDLRDLRKSNRSVFIPENVEHITIPFQDGNLEEARTHLPLAKKVLEEHLNEGKQVLVTCHQGKSRSVMLLLWYLTEKESSFLDAYWLIKGVRPIMEPDKKFQPLIDEWKASYPKEKALW